MQGQKELQTTEIIVFFYGITDDKSRSGSGMKVEQVTKTYVPPKCRHIGCKCRSNRRDSWIVQIPEIHDQVQIRSLQMHDLLFSH